eukprot:750203-Hanusia_phi.AAC.4
MDRPDLSAHLLRWQAELEHKQRRLDLREREISQRLQQLDSSLAGDCEVRTRTAGCTIEQQVRRRSNLRPASLPDTCAAPRHVLQEAAGVGQWGGRRERERVGTLGRIGG